MLKRSPALMMLLELAAMLLVFSLCAAVTVRLFFEARTMMVQSRRIGAAVEIAQIAAECYRLDGNAEDAAYEISAVWDADGYLAVVNRDGEAFTVHLQPRGDELQISVWFQAENLYEITVASI